MSRPVIQGHRGGGIHHTPSSNPTASSDKERYQTGPCKTPVFWRLARLEKRLDLCSATRNATPQAPCTEPEWALQTAKGTGQKREKPWENQGFLAERTGFEPAVGFDPYADLANRCFRPLSHLSGYFSQPLNFQRFLAVIRK
jgi:hypothetical protein